MDSLTEDILDLPIGEILEQEVPNTTPQNDLKTELENKSPISNSNLIKNVNNKVLIDYLSPEIQKNEESKRKHKGILILLLAIFIVVQFGSVYVFSFKVIEYATNSKASLDIIKSLLAFVSAYITSVVVELIAILNYIVKKVFDTSIAELIKIFKDTSESTKEQEG